MLLGFDRLSAAMYIHRDGMVDSASPQVARDDSRGLGAGSTG
jgi:hypothetical protein